MSLDTNKSVDSMKSSIDDLIQFIGNCDDSQGDTDYRIPLDNLLSATLSFDDIGYTIPIGTRQLKTFCRRDRPQKVILQNISGEFQYGLNAIMGPSGCGKSTFLDILCDRKDRRTVSGSIFIDGVERDRSFRHSVGYVVQEDICSETLTVEENIAFSSHLRSSKSESSPEKNKRIAQIIQELGLSKCAQTRVGNPERRGISGGERKRTCIAMELVLSPKILFLDEPTTGLDASNALNVIRCLQNISQRGCLILLSIHQPSYSILKLFDKVMFLCQGRCVFHGKPGDIVPYFSRYGYQYEMNENPADYVLDVLNNVSEKPETLSVWSEIYHEQQAKHRTDFKKTEVSPSIQQHQDQSLHSIGKELYYLSQRVMRNSFRNPTLLLSQIIVSIIMGFLVGLLFYDLDKTERSGVPNRFGAIFFIVISQIFSTVTAVEALIQERVLFVYEYASGYYGLLTFFTSKLICDLIPMRIVPSIFFSTICYFLMGLTRAADRFLFFVLTIFLSSVFGSSVCFFVAATVSTFALAFILITLILIVMMMFSGFLVDLESVLVWLRWLKWISAFRYASNALSVNEFQGLNFQRIVANQTFYVNGETVLEERGVDHDHAWDMWKNLVALSSMTIIFLFSTYIQLRRIKKTR